MVSRRCLIKTEYLKELFTQELSVGESRKIGNNFTSFLWSSIRQQVVAGFISNARNTRLWLNSKKMESKLNWLQFAGCLIIQHYLCDWVLEFATTFLTTTHFFFMFSKLWDKLLSNALNFKKYISKWNFIKKFKRSFLPFLPFLTLYKDE